MNTALIAGGGLAALYLLFGGKKASAQTPPKPPTSTVPPPVSYPTAPPGSVPTPTGAGSVAERMAAVLATGNPAAIRFEAARLRQEGFLTQATSLEKAAAELEAAQQQTAPPVVAPPVVAPPVVAPPVVLPPPVVPVPPPVVVAPPVVPPPASTVPVAQPWIGGVPAQLQGVVLRRTVPEVFDPRVVIWQDRLVELGFRTATKSAKTNALGSDGLFGPKTETETKAFQKARGLTPTGVVDAPTLAAAVTVGPPVAPAPAPGTTTVWIVGVPAELQGITADKPLKRTSPVTYDRRAELVQARLAELGYLKPTDVDGKFGAGTETAVKAFQKNAGIGVDGKVGPGTLAALANAGAVRMQGDEMFGYDAAPPVPQPGSPLPGLIPPMLPPDPDPRKALAARVAFMLFGAKPGQEDQTMIANFQAQEGLKASGYYGPATAEKLAIVYGIVPPKPRFWSNKHKSKAKANYRAMLGELGAADPQRVEEWKQASEV